MHVEFWLGNLKERDHLEDLGVDGRKNIKLPPSSEKSSELQLAFQWILKNTSCTKRKLRACEVFFILFYSVYFCVEKQKKKICEP